jgi:hypothetical protein
MHLITPRPLVLTPPLTLTRSQRHLKLQISNFKSPERLSRLAEEAQHCFNNLAALQANRNPRFYFQATELRLRGSADLESAVSRSCTPLGSRQSKAAQKWTKPCGMQFRDTAVYKTALQVRSDTTIQGAASNNLSSIQPHNRAISHRK